MAPEDEKGKAEKLAAAKKRLEALRKKKASQGGSKIAATTQPEGVISLKKEEILNESAPATQVNSGAGLRALAETDAATEPSLHPTSVPEIGHNIVIDKSQSSEAPLELDSVDSLRSELNDRHKEIESLHRRVKSLEAQVKKFELEQFTSPSNVVLERKVKQLEADLYEARSGQWRKARTELQEQDALSQGEGQFDDVDLSSSRSADKTSRTQGIGSFLADGFNTLTGARAREPDSYHSRLDSLLDDDLDDDLLEAEMVKAKEEEARKRVEKIREIKRGLIKWKGWRLDLADEWPSGRSAGEIVQI